MSEAHGSPVLPDYLKKLWEAVGRHRMSEDEFQRAQERSLKDYEEQWKRALLLGGSQRLEASLIAELGKYLGSRDLAEIRRRCVESGDGIEQEWHERVHSGDRASVEQFYENSQRVLYELVWWHTLKDDESPLAYVVALHFAQQHACRRVLDFGCGIGSGGILFARHGLAVLMADISSPLLQFSEWRFRQRRLPAQ